MRKRGRDLPWRANRDPYRILVSEMMLVQTTVTAVIPYFERFLRRFPDPGALAAADESEVLKVWEGLGYYRRARQLHAAARMIVDEHGGTMPDDPAAVRALPGVGRYIAGAILSFAFDRPEPIVEANSQRVLARLLAIKENLKTASTQERIWQAAERLVPGSGAGTFNQALMELGALVCTPREPSCLVCPLSALCEARRLGLQDRLARHDSETSSPGRHRSLCHRRRRGQGPDRSARARGALGAILGISYHSRRRCRPGGEVVRGGGRPGRGRQETDGYLRSNLGRSGKPLTYSVTNHRVKLSAYLAKARAGTPVPGPGLVDVRWVEPAKLVEYTFSSASRRLIAWINQEPNRLVAERREEESG